MEQGGVIVVAWGLDVGKFVDVVSQNEDMLPILFSRWSSFHERQCYKKTKLNGAELREVVLSYTYGLKEGEQANGK